MKRTADKQYDARASDLNHQLYKAGCGFYKENNYSKARRAFEDALEYWPEDPEAWLALENCLDELNKPKQAEHSFRNALKYCDPTKRADYCYNLGNSLIDQQKYDQAIECYSSIDASAQVFAMAQKNLKLALARNEKR